MKKNFSTRKTSGNKQTRTIPPTENTQREETELKRRRRSYLLVNTVIDLADLETMFEFTTNRVTM